MADDQKPTEQTPEETPQKLAGDRKELDGFQVTRSAAPPDSQGPPLGAIVFVLMLVVGGAAAFFMQEPMQEPLEATTPPPTDDGTTTETPTTDVEVPEHVWERLDFLEGEGNYETAYDEAVAANEETPNADLRAKIEEYGKELGLDEAEMSHGELLKRARTKIGGEDYEGAIEDCNTVLEEDEESAAAYFLRGKAFGLNGESNEAVGDLESALDLGYEPASAAERLLDKYRDE